MRKDDSILRQEAVEVVDGVEETHLIRLRNKKAFDKIRAETEIVVIFHIPICPGRRFIWYSENMQIFLVISQNKKSHKASAFGMIEIK